VPGTREPRLAIFSWKKSEPDEPKQPSEGGAAAEGGAEGAAAFSPEKAVKFFQHARTVDEATNYEYAAQLWLSGLRFDPNSMDGLQGFFSSIAKFNDESGGKKSVSREVVKSVSGKGEVDRFLMSLLEWGQRPQESTLAVRAAEASAALGLKEPTLWITERAFGFALRDKKVRKDLLLKCSECFGKAGAFDKALSAAEQALRLNPTDGALAAMIRDLAAQATMTKGGFDRSGEKGGFRDNIRDADKQRLLEEQERIVKTEDTVERLLAAAQEEYQKRPGDLPTIERMAKLLLERGKLADQEKAYQLYMTSYAETKQFRLRELAGDIRIRQARKKVTELKEMLAKSPGSEMIQRMLDTAQEDFAKLELVEFKARVDNYPSDLSRRFELGKRYFAMGQFHEAIEQFQESQHDPKNRAAALNLLGQSFQRIEWNDEAIDTFRHALEVKDILVDLEMELRYELMTALQAKAEKEQDIPSAEEADRLASGIARQQMSFRDIRHRREAIKSLLLALRTPKGGGA
jgi:tetratricopeptide (TPR) repeat protein